MGDSSETDRDPALGRIESVSTESRSFPPPRDFALQARVPTIEEYHALYAASLRSPEDFWAKAAEELHWFRRWDRVLDDSGAPFYKWFVGGRTNLSFNCLDRHLATPRRNKAAIVWEGEPGDERVLTYADLARETARFANGLRKLGVARGDRVAIYLPMIPELVTAVLACARIGAVHTVIFAGFSAESIRDRVNDCGAKVIVTADGGWRRGKILPLKSIVDEAISPDSGGCPTVAHVVVAKRGHGDSFPCHIHEGRDHWWHRLVEELPLTCPAEEMDSEDPLFLLYTSGTTGKPKGILHTTAGYCLYAHLTTKYVFDLRDEDLFWCTADIGWVTGHSYVVYGPLSNGATVFLYEGAPDWPRADRFWEMIEKYRVSIFYTAPTAIRAFMKWGARWPDARDLSSLRLLGTVGEPINPEAWIWYHEKIGGGRCPIVDTWWQTETGGILITPLPGAITTKPGSATLPFFGIEPLILDASGDASDAGFLAIRRPWPGMMRGIWGDPERYRATYWSKWPAGTAGARRSDGTPGPVYFPGDGARRDADGYFWILGRVDDVVNVAGHRIGTAELESAFVEHPAVAEAAVVGVAHDLKGQAMIAFVSLRSGHAPTQELEKELIAWAGKKIGTFARPERVILSGDLPKTRSGKIMRRLLRDIAEGRVLGNVTTLADAGVVEALKARYEGEEG